jgi:hypothetical protein
LVLVLADGHATHFDDIAPEHGSFVPTHKNTAVAVHLKKKKKSKWVTAMLPQFAPLSEQDRRKLAGIPQHARGEVVRTACLRIARFQPARAFAHGIPNDLAGSTDEGVE